MDVMAIIALVSKGMAVISALMTLAQDATPAVNAIKKLTNRKTPPTQADMDECESVLDGLLADFNLPLKQG